MAVGPDTPVTQLAGVGEARAKKLAKLGLARAADLLTYYPRDYDCLLYTSLPTAGGHMRSPTGQSDAARTCGCLLYTSRCV